MRMRAARLPALCLCAASCAIQQRGLPPKQECPAEPTTGPDGGSNSAERRYKVLRIRYSHSPPVDVVSSVVLPTPCSRDKNN